MEKIAVIILSVLLSAGSVSCQPSHAAETKAAVSASPAVINEVLPAAAYKSKLESLPNAQLIDVRTPAEYAQGHIQGFGNIDFMNSDFKEQVQSKLKKDQPVMMYCRSGRRSAKAAELLQSLGFNEIYDLQGGIIAWPEK
jgi:rhodanese-related sulfurtransferase